MKIKDKDYFRAYLKSALKAVMDMEDSIIEAHESSDANALKIEIVVTDSDLPDVCVTSVFIEHKLPN